MADMLSIVDVNGVTALVSFLGLGGAWWLIIFMGIIVLLGILLMMIFILTGGITFPFLMAKIRRRPMIAILRKDKKIVMGDVDYNQGMASTKKYGEFLIQPESVYTWPTGVQGFMAYADYGTSLPIDFVRATNVLKENNIEDYDQVEKWDRDVKKDNPDDQAKVNLPKTEYSNVQLQKPRSRHWWQR